jgi:hypothetical protein
VPLMDFWIAGSRPAMTDEGTKYKARFIRCRFSRPTMTRGLACQVGE